MCAACGRASGGGAMVASALEVPLARPIELSVGTKLVGELRRIGALGQPHSGTRAPLRAGSGDEYAGNDVFACVAWHDRMWNGESMEISKCRLFVGSVASGFERRMTSFLRLVCDTCRWMVTTYLDPVVHLDVLVRGIEV